eukprot:contig_2976_g626
MVGLTASVGSAKTFMLERIATKLRRTFVNRKGFEKEAAFARTRSPFGLSFNNHWTLHGTDADLVVMYHFPTEVLVHQRIVFMHRADLVTESVALHFRRFALAVSYMLRAKLLSWADLEREAVLVLASGRCPDLSQALPVLLVDEVGKADDSSNPSAARLIDHVRIQERPRKKLTDVTGEGAQMERPLHSPTTLLLSAACTAAQTAGGNVIL